MDILDPRRPTGFYCYARIYPGLGLPALEFGTVVAYLQIGAALKLRAITEGPSPLFDGGTSLTVFAAPLRTLRELHELHSQ